MPGLVKDELSAPVASHGADPSCGKPGPLLISDLSKLPLGSHCLSLYASQDEAADRAAAFLAGAEDPRSARYFVAGDRLLAFTRRKVRERSRARSSCVNDLRGPQAVRQRDGRFRPAPEVIQFVSEHPEGVSAGGQTITRYWRRETVPDHLEYEEWFDRQPRSTSRFLCPYDLREVPVDLAATTLLELAHHHSHLVLSNAAEPASLLLQLLALPAGTPLPPFHQRVRAWCLEEGLVEEEGRTNPLVLTVEGATFARSLRSFSKKGLSSSEVLD
ncbi:MAG: hypothetical protein KGJ23_09545 [Euryarchaeota archaeon]|nr:hypothetical protein [Euryarchaeota archaeon]MDE1879725.1 hypothetical protein [Euryarchaeota archaeon]MDE2046052.1 hypothetical protein [Thermoplasmata archaeon]